MQPGKFGQSFRMPRCDLCPAEAPFPESFANARLVNFEGAGHWVHHDKLDEFMRETEAFLAE